MQVLYDKVGSRQGYLQIFPITCHLISLHQCCGTEVGSHHCRGKLRKEEEPSSLPVEVISPACSTISFRLKRDKQICQETDLLLYFLFRTDTLAPFRMIAHCLIEIAKSTQKETNALGIILLWHHCQTTQVKRESLESLNHHQSADSRMFQKRQCLKHLGVQSIVWIPSLIFLLFTVFFQFDERIKNLRFHL